MSKDDTIAILETAIYPPGDPSKSRFSNQACPNAREYRVTATCAIGNIYQSRKFLYQIFRHARVFDSIEEAKGAANRLQNMLKTEHGICHIKDFKHVLWDEVERKYKVPRKQKSNDQNKGDCQSK